MPTIPSWLSLGFLIPYCLSAIWPRLSFLFPNSPPGSDPLPCLITCVLWLTPTVDWALECQLHLKIAQPIPVLTVCTAYSAPDWLSQGVSHLAPITASHAYLQLRDSPGLVQLLSMNVPLLIFPSPISTSWEWSEGLGEERSSRTFTFKKHLSLLFTKPGKTWHMV